MDSIASKFPQVCENLVFIGQEPEWYWEKIGNVLGNPTNDAQWIADVLGMPKVRSVETAIDVDIHGLKEQLDSTLSDNPSAIILGGSYNDFSDHTTYPYMHLVRDFTRKAIGQNIPILGICGGHQGLAWALSKYDDPNFVVGPRYSIDRKNHYRRIGIEENELTNAGSSDPLFSGFDGRYTTVMMQGCTVYPTIFDRENLLYEILQAVALATDHVGGSIFNQAVRYENDQLLPIYGIQANIPITAEVFVGYLKAMTNGLIDNGVFQNKKHLDQYVDRISSKASLIEQTNKKLFHNFISIVNQYRNQ